MQRSQRKTFSCTLQVEWFTLSTGMGLWKEAGSGCRDKISMSRHEDNQHSKYQAKFLQTLPLYLRLVYTLWNRNHFISGLLASVWIWISLLSIYTVVIFSLIGWSDRAHFVGISWGFSGIIYTRPLAVPGTQKMPKKYKSSSSILVHRKYVPSYCQVSDRGWTF